MMKKSIDEIMDMLNENNDEETQKQGIELGKKIENFNVFLKPRNTENPELLWENCAEIIYSKTKEELSCYFYNLLCWVKDLTVPGANKILNKLKEIKIESDINCDWYWILELNNFIAIVRKINDSKWLENLQEIKHFKADKVQSVEELMVMLKETNDEEIQKQGIELGKKARNFGNFIQPYYGDNPKLLWENCAKIICSKTQEELNPYVSRLIWWAIDLKEPGANKITNKLKEKNLKQSTILELDKMIALFEKFNNKVLLNNLLKLKKSLEVSK